MTINNIRHNWGTSKQWYILKVTQSYSVWVSSYLQWDEIFSSDSSQPIIIIIIIIINNNNNNNNNLHNSSYTNHWADSW